jgi:RHS repeat-associated protein
MGPGDHLGSTSLVLNDDGTVHSEGRYYPYGVTRWSSGTLPTDYRFTGQREESGLGLYQMGVRWYDVALGRWISADTVVPEPGNPQSFNRYSYVYNRPLTHIDRDGHLPFLVVTAGLGALIGGGVSFGTQLVANLKVDQSFGEALGNVDSGKVAGAAVAGGVMGLTLGVAAPTGLAATLAVGAVGGFFGGQAGRFTEAVWDEAAHALKGQGWDGERLLQNAADNGCLDLLSMGIDATSGAVSAGVGFGLAKALTGAGLMNNPLHDPVVSGNSGPKIYLITKNQIFIESGERTLVLSADTFDRLMYLLTYGFMEQAVDLVSEIAQEQTEEALENATP